ncbi:uncharacterized protein AB675_11821 [Cyphellophora attinorum]|uniref:F-box domain-containing protein n=1 Tax=Cyphellophora attinorum TaxID=1664694 RepID=A0A0N1GZV7_9EURO|nr:uncharacterized protein AB675_11821 [Phialophora attinorum]KPI36755.1 hypothetical protein AB675_11821 [Phialophora attinorum]
MEVRDLPLNDESEQTWLIEDDVSRMISHGEWTSFDTSRKVVVQVVDIEYADGPPGGYVDAFNAVAAGRYKYGLRMRNGMKVARLPWVPEQIKDAVEGVPKRKRYQPRGKQLYKLNEPWTLRSPKWDPSANIEVPLPKDTLTASDRSAPSLDSLPDEILLHIISFCDTTARLCLSRTNERYRWLVGPQSCTPWDIHLFDRRLRHDQRRPVGLIRWIGRRGLKWLSEFSPMNPLAMAFNRRFDRKHQKFQEQTAVRQGTQQNPNTDGGSQKHAQAQAASTAY